MDVSALFGPGETRESVDELKAGMLALADDGELFCPACEECGTYTLARDGDRLLARCQNCGEGIEITIVKCCDLHGRNCEPEEPCCRYCTETRHAGWTDKRGTRRYGHPVGEKCSVPVGSSPVSTP